MTDTNIDISIAEFKRKQKRTRINFLLVMIVVLSGTISILSFVTFRTRKAEAAARKAQEEAKARESELQRLEAETHFRGDLSNARKLDRADILRGVHGEERKKVVGIAIDLYEQKIPFTWGGKSPNTGFDSSGYVAYALNRAGLPFNPETDWSVRLRQKLKLVPYDKKEPGDVLLYEGGPCMFYLGGRDNLAIGALPGGIATGNPEFLNVKPVAVGRYP